MSTSTLTVVPGRPVLGRAPAHLGVVQPVERALDGGLRGDLDGVLRGLAVGDRLVEAHRDGLADADGRALGGRQVAVGLVVRHDGLEGAGQLLRTRLGLQRIGAAVAEVLGGGPGLAVLGQFAGDLLALVVGHGDRIELRVVDGHRHRLGDRPVLGTVLDVGHRLRLGLLDLRGLAGTVAIAHGASREGQRGDAEGRNDGPDTPAADQLNTHVLQSLHTLVNVVDSTCFATARAHRFNRRRGRRKRIPGQLSRLTVKNARQDNLRRVTILQHRVIAGDVAGHLGIDTVPPHVRGASPFRFDAHRKIPVPPRLRKRPIELRDPKGPTWRPTKPL